jgi:hypothetical protein
MRFAGRLLGALALAAALAARADVRAVLHAPRDGEVLRGGTQATVSWSASELPPFVEEWEAFLSVDGGRYYGYRITPHLDLQRREFTFDVPNVEAAEARILIRAGDERREIELETAQTFVIERDHARALAAAPLEVVESKRGEPAREGERGVIEWIDGNRDGSALTARSALDRECALRTADAPITTSLCGEEEGGESSPAPRGVSSQLALAAPEALSRSVPRSRTGRDLLLAYRRLNI